MAPSEKEIKESLARLQSHFGTPAFAAVRDYIALQREAAIAFASEGCSDAANRELMAQIAMFNRLIGAFESTPARP